MNRKDWFAVLLFTVLVVAFCMLLNNVDTTGGSAENDLVRDAVRSAAVTCYAVEGFYPDDITYLRSNYGLAYDEERYVVFYDGFASNIMPTIRVVQRGESYR